MPRLKLLALAEAIEELLRKRNGIVHAIATEQGKLAQRHVNDPPPPDSARVDFAT
jgi:hypothetical protein